EVAIERDDGSRIENAAEGDALRLQFGFLGLAFFEREGLPLFLLETDDEILRLLFLRRGRTLLGGGILGERFFLLLPHADPERPAEAEEDGEREEEVG